TLRGPSGPAPATVAELHAQGAGSWLLALTRELDDAILRLRSNEPELGTWLLRTEGDPAAVLAHERLVLDHAGTDWLCNEIAHFAKRTAKRLDVTSRGRVALVERGGCGAGVLLDLALACDRQYLLAGPPPGEGGEPQATLTLSEWNLGPLPMATGLTRLAARFVGDEDRLVRLGKEIGPAPGAAQAHEAGPGTAPPRAPVGSP